MIRQSANLFVLLMLSFDLLAQFRSLLLLHLLFHLVFQDLTLQSIPEKVQEESVVKGLLVGSLSLQLLLPLEMVKILIDIVDKMDHALPLISRLCVVIDLGQLSCFLGSKFRDAIKASERQRGLHSSCLKIEMQTKVILFRFQICN